MTSINSIFKFTALVIAFAFVFTLSLTPMVYAESSSTTKVTTRDDGMKSGLHDANADDDSAASSTEDKNDSNDDEDTASSTKDHNGRGDNEGQRGMSSIQDIAHNLDAKSIPELESLVKLLQQLLALILASRGA